MLYRYPGSEIYHRITQAKGVPVQVADIEELSLHSGYVFAPFSPSADSPVYVISGTHESGEWQTAAGAQNDLAADVITTGCRDKESYLHDFSTFHKKLTDGTFQKIVLARREDCVADTPLDVETLFFRACRRYPDQYVAMVCIATDSCWLMATPEVLLEGDEERMTTMALAGTVCGDAKWTEKDKVEQSLVADYIRAALRESATDIVEHPVSEVSAGQLRHLRTVFDFTVKNRHSVGKLISRLHPTPAVCGLPKDTTYEYILRHESMDRKYYSGFSGVMNFDGETRLYVTLRCAEIIGRHECHLYAGGGLLPDSVAEKEWQETVNKMNTIRQIL